MRPQIVPKSAHKPKSVYAQTLAKLRPAILGVLALSAATNVLMLTGSIYMLQVYDRVLTSGSMPTLYGLFAIVIILYGFLLVYDALRARLLSRVALRIDANLAKASFGHWLDTGLPDDSKQDTSQPLRDVETLRKVIASPITAAIFDLPFVPIFLVVLFIIHPWLGILTITGVGIAALIALGNRLITAKSIDRTTTSDNTEREFTEKSRRNAESIIGMGMQRAVTQRWSGLHNEMLSSSQAGSDPADVLASASRAFRMLLQSAILTLGAVLVLQGQITAGMIIAASILSGRVLAPIDQMIGQWRTVGRAMSAHKRLRDVFASGTDEPAYIDLPDPTGQITVTNLTKLTPRRPGTDSSQILSGISFELAPGDGLGVIGSSASGKSTLARLIVGASQPDEGEIRLDGATPDQWNPDVFGRFIGYLPQSVELIPGTIRDNISRFQPDISDEEVIAAARMTGVHDMILGLPEGYATRLGFAGDPTPLSGGQIQRIGLARAVCGMPKLVVMDEPNSNLDIAGDQALTKTIAALRAAGTAVIVMAHRPSALASLDKLMVLDKGKIKLFGDKDSILAPSQKHTEPDAPAKTPAEPQPSAFVRATHGSRIAQQAGPQRLRGVS